ncbi:MAG: GTP 3',8-cyclase MoaA [Planctomycetota bacterium]|nr:GTP 3',8-cyclase MoaA [Planctomycetota bacterium]
MNSLVNNPIVDSFGRIHQSLRISVTDRCNIRCFYCMPEHDVEFLPRQELLSFEEMTRFVSVVAKMGVNRLRLTGGEPLVRKNVDGLITQLRRIPGIEDIAMTTNGLLLKDYVSELKKAGLNRLNISLDGLSEATFQKISRRTGIQKVIDGIEAALDTGFDRIRLNAVSIAGITEKEIIPLARYAMERNLELRFIEFMPLDAQQDWQNEQVLPGERIKAELEAEFGKLLPAERNDPSQPALDFVFEQGGGKIGLINPVSQPFCQDCNRLRITAEGQIRNCLFSTTEWDARALLRSGATDQAIEEMVRECVGQKKAAHGIDTADFQRPAKAMFQIGG